MGAGLLLTIGSLVYMIILGIIYIIKNKLKSIENRFFGNLLLSNIIGLIIHLILYILMSTSGTENIITNIFSKLYLIYVIEFMMLFTDYVVIISFKNKEEMFKKKLILMSVSLLIVISLSIIIFALPIQFHNELGKMYSFGKSVDTVYLFGLLVISINICCLLFNIQEIRRKKYYPIIWFLLMSSVVSIIQYKFPYIQLVTSEHALILFLTYFTIENPDIKMIKELRYSKEMLEKSNQATMHCLDTLSENISKTLGKLFIFGNKKISKEKLDIDAFIKETKDIQKMSVEVVDQINGFIDLSRIESGEYSLTKYDYNPLETIEELKQLISIKIGHNSKNNFNINSDLPTVLTGDPSKIKQTNLYLMNTIINMFTHYEININITSMKISSLCRLRFSYIIKCDWMHDEVLAPAIQNNQLDVKSLDYKVFTKLIELQNGKYELKSSKDTIEFYFSIDQKINKQYLSNFIEENNFKQKPFNAQGKRILLVDDNRERIKELVKTLQTYNIEIGVAHNYAE